MDGGTLGLLDGGGSMLTNLKNMKNDDDDGGGMLDEVCSWNPEDDDDLELGLGLSIGGGLDRKEEESSRILRNLDCVSSSSSCSVNSSILGTKRSAIDSSVIGWPPIRRGHQMPTLANRIKLEHKQYSSRANGHLSVKVNMDGTLIGRKVDLNAHNSYETLARTLEDMFYGSLSSTETVGCSRLLNGTSEFVLTYEDKDGDCMLVGDVPWPMFVSSVKRLRILRTPKSRNC
ncbi:hypothetical protein OSB04_020458 [Centaurea solstitialis]|uniref:Auxin-responsive protein n=1 Tax=Centaurea solstitialis TaxID=347529 RepID=A0AA38T4E8_9ASTR|nr:hypothetical protein OSB04_020458 [Centaurea solstitialis]